MHAEQLCWVQFVSLEFRDKIRDILLTEVKNLRTEEALTGEFPAPSESRSARLGQGAERSAIDGYHPAHVVVSGRAT